MSPPTSASPGIPLRSAMKTDDEATRTPPLSGAGKAVQIAEPEPALAEEPQPKKQFPANLAKRLSGRPPMSSSSSRASILSQGSLEALSETLATASPSYASESPDQAPPHHSRHRVDHASQRLLAQVAEWIQHEKTKRENKKPRKHHYHPRRKSKSPPNEEVPKVEEPPIEHHRSASISSQSSEVSLDRLERILNDSMAALGLKEIPHYSPRLSRRSSGRTRKHHKSSLSLIRMQSSDTEYVDGDVVVPSTDAVLDNSKTMNYSGGQASSSDAVSVSSRREEKEKQAWIVFKNEIIRLAHTLRLKGWRRVPLDSGEHISVERLSGALTNAVYVVCPPEDIAKQRSADGKKPPAKLLLRVYGPQVEHLIDREAELGVLRRLARKKIGPRLLGTFTNGRFEQFFNSTTLTAADIREPETSKQIAKRMRELHDGIELLEEEKDEGPAVWRNWDKWVKNVEERIQVLDKRILSGKQGPVRGPDDAWKTRGLICGVEWHVFKAMVEKHRKFVEEQYGGRKAIRERLVFAHNDAQYGNILRLRPDDEKSPLLQPANEHKQLVVIDFEYASANVAGLEFANHFTEWMYNYHDPTSPWGCDHTRYPTLEQRHRFIKAYVDHHPEFPYSDSTPNLTPLATPTLHTTASSSSIVEFMLDARVPPGGWKEEEKRQHDQTEARIKELLEETRLWQIANSAQWVAWGIVQAKIPGFEGCDESGFAEETTADEPGGAVSATDEEEAEFDYLGYAQDRAYFFWGDCVALGLIEKEDLPEDLQSRLKIVNY